MKSSRKVTHQSRGKFFGWLWRWRNGWIAVALLGANALAWLGARSGAALPEVQPRLAPEIVAIREQLFSGQSGGQSFRIVVTDVMASEGVAWFLVRHPEVPFTHPWVEFTPEGVTGRGLAHVLGLRTPVHGRATLELRDGIPIIRLQEMGVAGARVPGFVIAAVRREAESRFDQIGGSLPFTLTKLELGEGTVTVEGIYK